MPPHYDKMDGPVVMAGKGALETGKVNLVLPLAPKRLRLKSKSLRENCCCQKIG